MNNVNKLRQWLRVSCGHNLGAMLVLVGANSLLLRTAEETSHVRANRFYTDLTGTGYS